MRRAQRNSLSTFTVQNGLEATAGGSRVDVRMRSHDGTLELTVSDSGPGLTAELRSQLFVPGFTTKAHGRIKHDRRADREHHHGTIAVSPIAASRS